MSAGRGTVSAVVPTLGASAHLGATLDALRADGGEELEIVLVAQGEGAARAATERGRADVWVELPENLGFSGGTNAGIAAARGDWIATVNDDAIVQPGWLAALSDALAGDPRAAAAQGTNRVLSRPGRIDGRGLAWNRWWQAVQLGHGREASRAAEEAAATEVFGVSATAALYRREALAAVALDGPAGGAVFDPRLISWYEDAELAGRLRGAGWRCVSVPAATALHAGSTSGGEDGGRRRRKLLHGNRAPVVARLLGRRFPAALPRLWLRDLIDLSRCLRRGDRDAVAGLAAGWLRAARLLPGYLHAGPPAVPGGELHRLAAERSPLAG